MPKIYLYQIYQVTSQHARLENTWIYYAEKHVLSFWPLNTHIVLVTLKYFISIENQDDQECIAQHYGVVVN